MRGLEQALGQLLSRYERLLSQVKIRNRNKVPISLEIDSRREGVFYYNQSVLDLETGKRTRKYIPKDQIKIAERLAQQAYYSKVQSLLEKRIPQIKSFLDKYEDDEIEEVYKNLHPGRKVLVTPMEPTWEQRCQAWKAQAYEKLSYQESAQYFLTNNDELVRSKSEKILADKFKERGITYKYECPLVLSRRKKFYPDFTFLCPHTYREVYWEHFGMMDNPEYSLRSIQKIEDYAMNGIFLGERLIVSFEAGSSQINDRVVDLLIERHLIRT